MSGTSPSMLDAVLPWQVSLREEGELDGTETGWIWPTRPSAWVRDLAPWSIRG